jgi:hypothetical protein
MMGWMAPLRHQRVRAPICPVVEGARCEQGVERSLPGRVGL